MKNGDMDTHSASTASAPAGGNAGIDVQALAAALDFLRGAEQLKSTLRSGYTATGRRESAAEHSWRLCLMAMLMAPYFPHIDFTRLVKLCIIHDLGEAIGGDIPAPEQAGVAAKAPDERRDFIRLLAPLPPEQQAELLALWDEYEAARTPAARLAKALDKLETILQHTQGKNPPGFDYRFNLTYGVEYTRDDPVIVALRRMLDAATEERADSDAGGEMSDGE